MILEERQKTLSLLRFLKEIMGKMKGSTCVNRVLEEEYIKKANVAPSIVVMDSVFLTGAVDAY